jgi:hypothetical protein
MKKHWYIVFLPLGFSLLVYSCGGRFSKEPSNNPKATETIEAIDSTDMLLEITGDEDDGDPNIKAASVDKMKMVIDDGGNVVGRYVQTNQTTYTISVQDEIEVPIEGHKVVVFSAKNGEGIIFTRRTNVNVRTQPTLESPAICQISFKEGELPKTYPCLGKTQGWYKIKVRGTEGYVRHDLVVWDGMDTF